MSVNFCTALKRLTGQDLDWSAFKGWMRTWDLRRNNVYLQIILKYKINSLGKQKRVSLSCLCPGTPDSRGFFNCLIFKTLINLKNQTGVSYIDLRKVPRNTNSWASSDLVKRKHQIIFLKVKIGFLSRFWCQIISLKIKINEFKTFYTSLSRVPTNLCSSGCLVVISTKIFSGDFFNMLNANFKLVKLG